MYPKRVWIAYGEEDQDMGFWQYCDYEQIPDMCSFCKKVGHSKSECKVFDKMYEKEKNSKQSKQRAPKSLKPMNQERKQQPKSNSYTSNKEKENQINKERGLSWKKVWKRKKGNEGGHSSGLSIQEKEQAFKAKNCEFPDFTSCNKFDVLTRQEEETASTTQDLSIMKVSGVECQENSQGIEAHKEEQNSSNLIIKEKDSDEDFLAEQRAFLTSQELAKVVGATYPVVIQSSPPISICIKNPATNEIISLERNTITTEENSPLLLEYKKDPNQVSTVDPTFIQEGELSVDLYSSNWETEVDEKEEKKRRIAKKWKGILIANEEKKVKAHRYNTRNKKSFKQNDNYYNPSYEDYGSC